MRLMALPVRDHAALEIGATAKGKLKRSDFGLHWNAPLETGGLLVGDDVKLEFELEFLKTAQTATA